MTLLSGDIWSSAGDKSRAKRQALPRSVNFPAAAYGGVQTQAAASLADSLNVRLPQTLGGVRLARWSDL
jgi:hypothetical protein